MQPEGEGCYTWADGSTYEGAWHAGLKHGWGTYRWPNGACYRGEWRDGFMQVRRRRRAVGAAGCRLPELQPLRWDVRKPAGPRLSVSAAAAPAFVPPDT